VKVETACPLSATDRATLEASVEGSAPSLVYHVNEELRGGVRIWTAQGLIDASIAGLSRYAEQVLRQEMNNHTAASTDQGRADHE
jgi:hypothetical protein